jgi:hypothetical protein
MTITTNPTRDEYTSSAGQTVFNYTFKIFEATDLNVYVTPAGQECDDSTDLTTDYVVDSGTIGDEAGGFITFNTPLNNGDMVTIVSDIPSSRTTDYQNNGDFRPDTVNNDFDRVVSLVKQVEGLSNRSLLSAECRQGPKPLILPEPDGLKLLRWRADEKGLENITLADISPDTIVAQNIIIIYPTVSALKSATDEWLVPGQLVKTAGYNSIGDGGHAEYLIATNQPVDGFSDHLLANTNTALLQSDITTSRLGVDLTGVLDSTPALFAGNEKGGMIFSPGTHKVSSNLILSKDIVVQQGAILSPDNSITITIDGNLSGSASGFLAGEGSYTGKLKGTDAKLSWFPIAEDSNTPADATTNTTQLGRAVTAFGKFLTIDQKIYVNGTTVLPSLTSIRSANRALNIEAQDASSNFSIFRIENGSRVYLDDMEINGNNTNTTGVKCLEFTDSAFYCRFNNVDFIEGSECVHFNSPTNVTQNIKFTNCTIRDADEGGCLRVTGKSTEVTWVNCTYRSAKGTSPANIHIDTDNAQQWSFGNCISKDSQVGNCLNIVNNPVEAIQWNGGEITAAATHGVNLENGALLNIGGGAVIGKHANGRGIYAQNSLLRVAHGCEVYNCLNEGIRTLDCDNSSIYADVHSCNLGVLLQGDKNTRVGGEVYLNDTRGIFLQGVDDSGFDGVCHSNSQSSNQVFPNIEITSGSEQAYVIGAKVFKGIEANKPSDGVLINSGAVNTHIVFNILRQAGDTGIITDNGTTSIITPNVT